MCRLCKGHNSVYQDIGWGRFSAPARKQSGDLTETIKAVLKMKTRVKQSA